MLTRQKLAAACSANDEQIHAGIKFEMLLQELNVEPQGAAYVAEQRALRVALIFEGWSPDEIYALAHEVVPRRVRLDPTMQMMMPSFASLWLDGFCTGLRVTDCL